MIKVKFTHLKGRGRSSNDIKGIDFLENYFDNGYRPYTFNLISSIPIWLDMNKALYIDNKKRSFWKGYMFGEEIIIYRWHTCPAHVIEIISKDFLCTKFQIGEGDTVEIDVSEIIAMSKFTKLKMYLWKAFWEGREDFFYKSNFHKKNLRSPLKRYFYLLGCQLSWFI